MCIFKKHCPFGDRLVKRRFVYIKKTFEIHNTFGSIAELLRLLFRTVFGACLGCLRMQVHANAAHNTTQRVTSAIGVKEKPYVPARALSAIQSDRRSFALNGKTHAHCHTVANWVESRSGREHMHRHRMPLVIGCAVRHTICIITACLCKYRWKSKAVKLFGLALGKACSIIITLV